MPGDDLAGRAGGLVHGRCAPAARSLGEMTSTDEHSRLAEDSEVSRLPDKSSEAPRSVKTAFGGPDGVTRHLLREVQSRQGSTEIRANP